LLPPVPSPLFKVLGVFRPLATKPNVNPGSEDIPYSHYKTIKVRAFLPGVSKQSEFDPLVHLEIEQAPKEGEEPEDEFAVDESERILERQKVENLHEHWLLVEPA
jgi:hypothetical protein